MSLNLSTIPTQDPPSPAPRRSFLTPLPDPGHFLLVMDNTGLSMIKRCHMAARNYLILGREGQGKSAPLIYGGAIHQGLEAFLLGKTIEQQESAIVNHCTNEGLPPDEFRTVPNAIQTLKHYREHSSFPDYQMEILTDEHGPIVEKGFELPFGVLEFGPDHTYLNEPLTHIHIAWSGRIDCLARIHNKTYVLDHKTGWVDTEEYHLSSQAFGYAWAAEQLWPEHGPFGFCLDALQCKAVPKGCTNLLDKGPRGGEQPLKLFRAYYPTNPTGTFTSDQLSSWRNDTLAFIEDFLHSTFRQHFPLNDKACKMFNKMCQYHLVCTEPDPAMREALLGTGNFKAVTWNPLAGR